MDKRNFTRVDFSAGASISCNGQVIAGKIENLSLQGMYVKTAREIPLHLPLDVTVQPEFGTSFTLQASAVRCNGSSLGMKIMGMDVLSFVQLRNAVALQCSDHDEVMRETFKVVGYIN